MRFILEKDIEIIDYSDKKCMFKLKFPIVSYNLIILVRVLSVEEIEGSLFNLKVFPTINFTDYSVVSNTEDTSIDMFSFTLYMDVYRPLILPYQEKKYKDFLPEEKTLIVKVI